MKNETLDAIKRRIKYYPDWPQKGVRFIDLLPLMSDKETFSTIIEELGHMVTTPNVAAPEARGFLFSSPLLINGSGVCNFIPFRKSGKLPAVEGDLVDVSIMKEYGEDHLFFRRSDVNNAVETDGEVGITLLDDVLATGGTGEGMAECINRTVITRNGKPVKVKVKEFVFLAEIEFLDGKSRLEKIAPVKSLIKL